MRIGESPFRRLLTRDSLGEATALAFIYSDRKGATRKDRDDVVQANSD